MPVNIENNVDIESHKTIDLTEEAEVTIDDNSNEIPLDIGTFAASASSTSATVDLTCAAVVSTFAAKNEPSKEGKAPKNYQFTMYSEDSIKFIERVGTNEKG